MNTVQLPDGRFDVQDQAGKSVLDGLGGPFLSRGAAEAACRMMSAFDEVDLQIKSINRTLEAQQ